MNPQSAPQTRTEEHKADLGSASETQLNPIPPADGGGAAANIVFHPIGTFFGEKALTLDQINAQEELIKRWHEYYKEKDNNASSETINKKRDNIYQYLAGLEKQTLTAVLESMAVYHPSRLVREYFLQDLLKEGGREHYAKIIELIPHEDRVRLLYQMHGPLLTFLRDWMDVPHSAGDTSIWQLRKVLDNHTTETFFDLVAPHDNYVIDFLESAPDYDSFDALFSESISYKRANDFVAILKILGLGSDRNMVAKRFVELTNPQQREAFITKLSPELQRDFRIVLQDHCQTMENARVEEETEEEAVKPDSNSESSSAAVGSTHPPVQESTKVYWIISIIFFTTIMVLSALYATAIITSCIAVGGLLGMGLMFCQTQGYWPFNSAPSITVSQNLGPRAEDRSEPSTEYERANPLRFSPKPQAQAPSDCRSHKPEI